LFASRSSEDPLEVTTRLAGVVRLAELADSFVFLNIRTGRVSCYNLRMGH
jgi:hypothetical protein